MTVGLDGVNDEDGRIEAADARMEDEHLVMVPILGNDLTCSAAVERIISLLAK